MLREGSGECREVGLAQNHQSALRVAHGLDHALPHGQNAAFHQTDTSEGGCYTPPRSHLSQNGLSQNGYGCCFTKQLRGQSCALFFRSQRSYCAVTAPQFVAVCRHVISALNSIYIHLYFFFGRSTRGPSAPASYGTRAGRQLGTGGQATCRTSCRGGACAPGIGAWTGGDPSKVAASVFCTATLSRPHQRLYQPWVAAPRSGARARRARERCCGTTWPSGPTASRTTLIPARSSGLARRARRPVRGQAA